MNVGTTRHDGAARIVALIVAADGTLKDSDLRALEGVRAFGRLGIERERFIELAETCASEVGSHLGETSWLRNGDRAYVDRLLCEVSDPAERELVCQLAGAVMAAERAVSNQARMLYAHLLASWRVCAPAPGAAQAP